MNCSPKGQFVAQSPIAFDEPLNRPNSAVDIVEVLPLIYVANHLAEIVGQWSELGELPVDYEQLVRSSWVLSPQR